MPKMPLIAILLTAAATVAGAQAPAPGQVRVPGVSAAGNAALQRMGSKTDPAGVALVQQQRGMQQQMAAILNAPTLDVDKLAATMKAGRDLESQMRAVADRHVIDIIRVLPLADRKPFLLAITRRQGPPPAK